MSLRTRLTHRLRMRTLVLLGPQLGRQHGPVGWLAAPALNRLHRAVITDSVAALDLAPGATVADIGFGGGIGLRMLLRAVGPTGTVHGVELSEMSVRRARLLYRTAIRQGRLRLHEAPVERLPFAPASIDAALTVNTIHHFVDLDVALASLATALRPGGRLVLGFPDPDRQATLDLTSRHGHHPRPLGEVQASLRGAGFSVAPTSGGADVYHVLLASRDAD